MTANHPTADFASVFTKHVAHHARVSYYPRPYEQALVLMVVDELLVGAAALANTTVTDFLTNTVNAVDTGHTVFEQPADDTAPWTPPAEDVAIWRLREPGSGTYPDVAEAVWKTRELLSKLGIGPEQVAPNHVLIPAPDYHTCPWGPPDEREPENRHLAPLMDGEKVRVAVIDAGYLDLGPIVGRVTGEYGYWLKGAGWVKESALALPGLDALDQDDDKLLDALIGHANFVAGVIAQTAPRAEITVVSHNGSFVKSDDEDVPIPTEAAVARSLWERRNSHVINVGFAFATLPDVPLIDDDISPGPPSWALSVVLDALPTPGPMIVAPAGNQNSMTPQFPAAFAATDPRVVGVGSLAPGGNRPSDFTNHGPWVTCATEGEDVVSTFIVGWHHRRTEEREPKGSKRAGQRPAKDFDSGWATWSGTSFAAPKVTAAIANEWKSGLTPQDAWTAAKTPFPKTPDKELGILMSGLPPV